MIDFDVKHRIAGTVLFTAKIECDNSSSLSVKLGLAVEWAVKNKAHLRGADLRGATLRGADLRGATLRGADLRGATLRGADLEGADLEGADLRGANLRGVNLEDANLMDVNLKGADLEGAKNIYHFGDVGVTHRIGYVVRTTDGFNVKLGRYWGSKDSAIGAIRKKYGSDSLYEKQILLACDILSAKAEDE